MDFASTPTIKVTPCFARMTHKFAFCLFLLLDLIPNFFYGLYFILLTVIELFFIFKIGLTMSDPRYYKFATIRILFYLFTTFFVLIVQFLFKDKEESFLNIKNLLIYSLVLVFCFWNIYMTVGFRRKLNSLQKIKGYLASGENSIDNFSITNENI